MSYANLVEFEVFAGANLTAPGHSALPDSMSVGLTSGHLYVTLLDPRVEFTLNLQARTLRTTAPLTRFVVCQDTAGAMCGIVLSGELQLESGGESTKLSQGQSIFAEPGMAPGSPTCIPPAEFDQWLSDIRAGTTTESLGQFVGRFTDATCEDVSATST